MHVDVRVTHAISLIAATDHKKLSRSCAFIQQMVPIGCTCRKSGAVSGLHVRASRVGDQHKFTAQHIDKLIFGAVPMPL